MELPAVAVAFPCRACKAAAESAGAGGGAPFCLDGSTGTSLPPGHPEIGRGLGGEGPQVQFPLQIPALAPAVELPHPFHGPAGPAQAEWIEGRAGVAKQAVIRLGNIF